MHKTGHSEMRAMLNGVPTVGVWRGAHLESVHDTAACVTDAAGDVLFARGTIDARVYPRSSAKPFIAAASVRAGVAERFGFGDAELAIMSGSHRGEPAHTTLVASMLERIGAGVEDLRCGVHVPYDAATAALLAERCEPATPLHHNCSGKHAGILALARVLGAPFEGYLEPYHPAQQVILAFCGRMSDEMFGADNLGIDGCGIPAYVTTLRHAALSYARLATLQGVDDDDAAALARISEAMVRRPWFVAGTGAFDTDLIGATDGRVVGKSGAEGFHASAMLDQGLGLALKVVDGAGRAAPPAVLALLDAHDALSEEARAALAPYARPAVTNVAKTVVGSLRVLD